MSKKNYESIDFLISILKVRPFLKTVIICFVNQLLLVFFVYFYQSLFSLKKLAVFFNLLLEAWGDLLDLQLAGAACSWHIQASQTNYLNIKQLGLRHVLSPRSWLVAHSPAVGNKRAAKQRLQFTGLMKSLLKEACYAAVSLTMQHGVSSQRTGIFGKIQSLGQQRELRKSKPVLHSDCCVTLPIV